MLKEELQYYIDHQQELVEKYEGKFIVIKEKKVIGVYDTLEDAYIEAQKEHELGTFLIQECLPGEDSYTQTYHSRVLFS